jgi:O-antigen/teichoic acid export membrane protein
VVLSAGLFALVISVFAADAIRILATPAYAPAAGLVPFLCLSVVFYGAYRFATLGSELAEKTRIRSMVVMAAGLVNLGLNSVLSRMWGVPGVIFSENLSYFLLFLSMMIYSQHCHPLPYSFRRVSTALVLFAGLYLATRGLEPGTLLGMGIKLVVVSLVPLVFWFGGMLKREEKAALMRIVGALRQRLA